MDKLKVKETNLQTQRLLQYDVSEVVGYMLWQAQREPSRNTSHKLISFDKLHAATKKWAKISSSHC